MFDNAHIRLTLTRGKKVTIYVAFSFPFGLCANKGGGNMLLDETKIDIPSDGGEITVT